MIVSLCHQQGQRDNVLVLSASGRMSEDEISIRQFKRGLILCAPALTVTTEIFTNQGHEVAAQRTESNTNVPLIPMISDSIVTVYFCILGSPSHRKPVDSQLPLDPSSMVVIVAELAVAYSAYRVPSGKDAIMYATVTSTLGKMKGNPIEVEVKKITVREDNRSVETASKYHH